MQLHFKSRRDAHEVSPNACLTLHIHIYIIIPEVRGSIPPEASYYYLVLQHTPVVRPDDDGRIDGWFGVRLTS